MWQLFSEPALSSRLCLTLLHSLWQATLFAIAAAAVGRLWRRKSVERDYAFHVVALLASLAVMPVTFASVSVTRPSILEATTLNPTPGVAFSASNRLRNPPTSIDAAHTPKPSTIASSPADVTSDNHREWSWTPLAPWIAVLYGLGVVLMLARLAAGVWQANRLGHRGEILREGPLVELVRAMATKWSMSVMPVLVRVDEIFVPKVVGLIWPKILLPASALTGLSAAELEMILLHELAHLRRHDMWVSLLQRLAEAVLFFNPAAWYQTRRIGTLRECCCDEMTCRSLAHQGRARAEYALALLRVAELARASLQQAGNRRSIEQHELVALSANGRSPSQLRLRLASLFGEPVREPLRLSAGGMLTVLALALALLFGPVSWRSAANSAATSEANTPPKQKAADATAEMGDTAPINVSGQALDAKGKPIAGAKIYLVSQERIGETTTDASGRYSFRNARLPIAHPDTYAGLPYGTFLIYGRADGHGFAWRPTKWYYPKRNSNTYVGWPGDDEPHVFQADDPIELDLHFAASTTVRGRIVDDHGKPIANTKLAIWDCERIPPKGYRTKSGDRSAPEFNVMDRNEFQLLNADVPSEMRSRRTDATGRFEFTGLPAGCRFRVSVNPPGFASRGMWFATRAGLRKEYDGCRLYDGLEEIEVRFAATRNVPIQVLYGDIGKPAVKAWVELAGKNGGAATTSDAVGRAQLEVPAGQYRLHLLPAYKTPYLETESALKVDAQSPIAEHIIKLRPAAMVEIKVLDQETGRGIPNVDLWHELKGGGREEYYSTSWEVATHIVHRDRERTDKNGVIREFLEPGKHRIGVALEASPKGYAPMEPDGKEIDCQPGKPILVVFRMINTARTAADR